MTQVECWQSQASLPKPVAMFTRILLPAALGLALPAAASAASIEPFEFFEGRTENQSTVKVALKKSYSSRAIGHGRREADGTFTLVQKVEDQGRPTHERRWHVRQVGPGRYSATMNEAVGPVTIERVGDRYRFRFKMKGKLSAEQWLSPLPGGRAARSIVRIKKLGVTVATTEGIIRKVGR